MEPLINCELNLGCWYCEAMEVYVVTCFHQIEGI